MTKFPGVIVAKITAINPHPNADRLCLATVDTGKEQLTVVCGAPNIAVGQLVPLATLGAQLPNGMEIKPAIIRGVSSSGMLCAADELGLGSDHNGILLLNSRAITGGQIDQYLNNF